jgi:mono/diheme cytochrome c family protein
MRSIMGFIVAFALAPGIAVSVARAQQAQSGDAAKGRELYAQYTCYGCHGFSGQNGPGNRLVPMRMTQTGFTGYVRRPPRPNRMPSYSTKVLSDVQLADIWAYLRTLPDAPALKDIPVLVDIQQEK